VAVDTPVDVDTPVHVAHRQYALAAVADPTVMPLAPMPRQHVVARLMVPHMPQWRVVAALTAAVANRTVAANTLAGSC
jgi:hypothetical protein